jgi:hypothetical protein
MEHSDTEKISMTAHKDDTPLEKCKPMHQYPSCMAAEPVHDAADPHDGQMQEEADGERREAAEQPQQRQQKWRQVGSSWQQQPMSERGCEDWSCSACNLVVFSWRQQCPRCGHWWEEEAEPEEDEAAVLHAELVQQVDQ